MTASGQGLTPRRLTEFRDRYRTPALGAAIVNRDGATEVAVTGVRQRGGTDNATVDDLWHIGSCAKAITAALYACLVESGDAAWETPISELFPDLADELHGDWSSPTVEELFVCRSGMAANLPRRAMIDAFDDPRSQVEQRTAAAVSALAPPPSSRGSFRYSNLSYIVVGAAIDRIVGAPFEEALRTVLLSPLDITSAGFGPPPAISGHAAKIKLNGIGTGLGPATSPDGLLGDNPPILTPAGRLHLSLADWTKFHHMILNEGGELLQPNSVERLLRVPEGRGKGMAMGWATTTHLKGASYAMQGSNTFWVATAMIDAARCALRGGCP